MKQKFRKCNFVIASSNKFASSASREVYSTMLNSIKLKWFRAGYKNLVHNRALKIIRGFKNMYSTPSTSLVPTVAANASFSRLRMECSHRYGLGDLEFRYWQISVAYLCRVLYSCILAPCNVNHLARQLRCLFFSIFALSIQDSSIIDSASGKFEMISRRWH